MKKRATTKSYLPYIYQKICVVYDFCTLKVNYTGRWVMR